MSDPLPIWILETQVLPAFAWGAAILGALLVCSLLIAFFRAGKRDAKLQEREADLDRRTADLAKAEQAFEAEREAREQQLRLLLRELTHRSKNLLAVIQAIARQTARQTTSVDEFLDRFGARLHGIGMSHDLLVADDWQGASLRMLVEQQLEPHMAAPGDRVTIKGEDIVLKPEAVQNLGMALHELTANAEKFGSLSSTEGTVFVGWLLSDDARTLTLTWDEKGGPPVTEPTRSGFGRAMIENVVSQALEGQVALSFPAGGVHCEIAIPATLITSRG